MGYGLLGKRRDPKAIDRAMNRGQAHNPTLDEFTLLASIAAIYNGIGLRKEVADCFELLGNASISLKLDAKLRGNDG